MIEKLVKPYISAFQKKFLMPLKRAKNLPKLLGKWIKRKFKEILGQKEITKASYVPIGNYYISKKLIVIILIVIMIICFFVFVKPPKFIKKWINFKPSITSVSAKTYSGEAKLYHDEGYLLYEGELADGKYQGSGKLFYANGNLYQSGAFEEGLLAQGKEYNAQGILNYDGSFKNGMYAGQGTLYALDGKLKYQGEFQAGEPNGTGRMFTENGKVRYEGSFLKGVFSGDGVLYSDEGQIVYQGQFLAGRYNGTGKQLYPDGVIQYEGGFLSGLFSQQGTLYDQNGVITYKGSFQTGKFHGLGQRFDRTGALEYEGMFVLGQLNGIGTWFRSNGTIAFKGMFINDEPSFNSYLGMSAVRIEEVLGTPYIEPTDTNSQPSAQPTNGDALSLTPDNASPPPSGKTILRYQDMGLTFVFERIDDASFATAVAEVRIGPGDALNRLYTQLDAASLKDPSIGPSKTRANESIYIINGIKYTITFMNNTLQQAIIR